jgi:hypothetical protein
VSPSGPVRATAVLLWVLVALGPLLGTAALLGPADAAVAGPDDRPPPAAVGTAELAVRAHLAAVPGAAPAALAPAHPALRAAGDPLADLGAAERQSALAAAAAAVDGVGTIGHHAAGPDRWGVVVGVLRSGRLEAWQVTVAVRAGTAVVESLPARLAVPAATAAPPVPATSTLRRPEPDDPVHEAVRGFLGALLAGDGDLGRYVAAGADVRRPEGPDGDVELLRIAAGEVDAAHVAVLAEVRVREADGAVRLLHYPLLLRPAGGRWEVQRLLPALPVRPDPPTHPGGTAAPSTRSTS